MSHPDRQLAAAVIIGIWHLQSAHRVEYATKKQFTTLLSNSCAWRRNSLHARLTGFHPPFMKAVHSQTVPHATPDFIATFHIQ